jgi:phosphate-selective porin
MMGAACQLAYMVTGGDWSENPDDGLEAVLQLEHVTVEHGGNSRVQDVWACTLGMNYYFNAHARFMLNLVATDVGDDVRTPVRDGNGRYEGGTALDYNLLARLQLVF